MDIQQSLNERTRPTCPTRLRVKTLIERIKEI